MGNAPVTSSMMQMLEGMTEEQVAHVGEQINHFIQQYKLLRKTDRLSTIHAFHEAIERELNSESVKNNPYFKRIACKKGCGFCCYVNVDINEDEAELIYEYCKEQGIEIDPESLKKQSTRNDKTYHELTTAEKKCTFLANDMTCKIYKHRPGACRKFNALDSNKACESDSNEIHPLFGSMMLEIIQIAIYKGARTANMPTLLLEKLDKHKQ